MTQKVQQRRQGFGIKVRNNYMHRRAICRARICTPNGESLVEGAHIIPWSESKNDDPRNGLALCKTHHWMFDAYLLAIQPDYHIQLSQWLIEEREKVENTLVWNKMRILLPNREQVKPNAEALEERYKKFLNNG